MSRRGNTLEDIGRKAVEASVATSTWRRLRGVPCEIPEPASRKPYRCPELRMVGQWCKPCWQRREAYEEHRRAKNSLLVAIRSYIRRTSAPSTL